MKVPAHHPTLDKRGYVAMHYNMITQEECFTFSVDVVRSPGTSFGHGLREPVAGQCNSHAYTSVIPLVSLTSAARPLAAMSKALTYLQLERLGLHVLQRNARFARYHIAEA